MPPLLRKSITLKGHRTSLSLEAVFWDYLNDCAQEDNLSVPAFIAIREVDMLALGDKNLSSFLRCYLLKRALASHPRHQHPTSSS